MLPKIPEEKQTPVVKVLLALLEQYTAHIVSLEESVANLKDKFNVLKGEKKCLEFGPSGLDKFIQKNRLAPGEKIANGQDKRKNPKPRS